MLDLVVQIVFGFLTYTTITLFGSALESFTAPRGAALSMFIMSLAFGTMFILLLIRG